MPNGKLERLRAGGLVPGRRSWRSCRSRWRRTLRAVSELTKVSAAHQDVLAEMDELEEAWLEAADLLE